MTRGQITIVLDNDEIITSTEFNGDMYYDDNGRGKEVVRGLKKIKTKEDHEKFVKDFNENYYQYKEDKLTFSSKDNTEYNVDMFDFSKDYFEKWFSDYIYVKNLSKKDIGFILSYGKPITIKPNEIMIFEFGKLYTENEQINEKISLAETLNELKENLSADTRNNYYTIYNACADYDNKYKDLNLVDNINQREFLSEEDVISIIKNRDYDLTQIRCFLNDTENDSLYQLDGYANLKNISVGDFENLIDDLMSNIHYSIVDEYEAQKKNQEEL